MSGVIDMVVIDGREVVFRHPKKSDAKKMQKFMNQAVDESLDGGGYLSRTEYVSLNDEKEWLKNLISKIKSEMTVHIVAECDRSIIGNVDVNKEQSGAFLHRGSFGIVILKRFTSKGLGTVLTDKIIKLAKRDLKLEILKLNVYGNNKRAQGLYKKMGFKEIGRIKKGRKIKGKYADDILMVKYL